MIDVFIQEKNQNECNLYFVQMGCIYTCENKNIDILCENAIRLYHEFLVEKNRDFEYNYIPLDICNDIYRKEKIFMKSDFINVRDYNIKYSLQKIC